MMETIRRKDGQAIIENQYYTAPQQSTNARLSEEVNFHKQQVRVNNYRDEIEETRYRLVNVGMDERSELFESISALYQ